MKKGLYALLTILLIAGGAFAFNTLAANSGERYSVDLSVSRLTCGSCIETIRDEVSALAGTQAVTTDLARARSFVEFDPERVDAQRIAEVISAAGYPATVLFVRDASGTVVSGIDLDRYVARIGSRMIARSAYQQAFQQRMDAAELSGRAIPLSIVSREAWQALLRQELLLNAADQFDVRADENDLEKRLAETADSGVVDREILRNALRIEGYLALQYPDGQPTRADMAQLLNGLSENTAVDVFDPHLKRYLGGGSGSCGGTCCG